MEIKLPDLGSKFEINGINEGNKFNAKTEDGKFQISPGVYLLKRSDVKEVKQAASKTYIAPEDKKLPLTVVYEPYAEITAGKDFEVTAKVCESNLPDKVSLFVLREPHKIYKEYEMQRQKNYEYSVKVPAGDMNTGLIRYCITVESGAKSQSFPGNIASKPWDWDFQNDKLWETFIADDNTPIALYDVNRDRDKFLFSQYWHGPHYTYNFVKGMDAGKLAFHLEVENLKEEPRDVSGKYILDNKSLGRADDFGKMKTLRVRARAAQKNTTAFGITLMEKDGSGWLATVLVTEQWQEIKIPLSELKISKSAMLPRGWSGHSYWLSVPANRGSENDKLNPANIEAFVISIGDRFGSNIEVPQGIEIERMELSKF
jgi:hypothetical protein